MTKNFNPKMYQGKARVYSAIPRSPRISRLWVWDEARKEYTAPDSGNVYYAARYEVSPLKGRKRVYESFATLEEARAWQSGVAEVVAPVVSSVKAHESNGPLFSDVVEEWKRRRFPQLAYSTQLLYEKILRLYFGSLFGLRLQEITPKAVDCWLDELKAGNTRSTRTSFEHELELLSAILNYFINYNDDVVFQFPIKKRHREAMVMKRATSTASKDLAEEEFLKFREELRTRKGGRLLAAMATVQYYQALRISETAGLYWEDIMLDLRQPQNSRVRIVRSVCFPHQKGIKAFVKGGFKNAAANGGVKEQPMFPETYEALLSLYREGNTGLVFTTDGEPIPYKTIQCHYDASFKRAGLPYRGTHVMRHGGCRRVFNEVGELPIAQQLLGNADLKTTLVYAKRHASALTKVAHQYWERKPRLLATACESKFEIGK